MTRERAKELLPIIQAYVDGKQIQLKVDDKWITLVESDFLSSPNSYRIKPEPREFWLVADPHGKCCCGHFIEGNNGWHAYNVKQNCVYKQIHVREVID